MTETEIDQVEDDDAETVGQAGEVPCRHCGRMSVQSVQTVAADEDWQCPHCERWQHTVLCPTCHQTVNIALLSEDMVPAAHAPVRRRRSS